MPLQEVPRWSRSGVSAVGGEAFEGFNREGVSEGLPSFRHSLQSAPHGSTRQELSGTRRKNAFRAGFVVLHRVISPAIPSPSFSHFTEPLTHSGDKCDGSC